MPLSGIHGRLRMFGFGYLEIGILALILILIFGTRRAGRIFRQGFDTYRQIDKTRQDLKKSFNILDVFRRNDRE